MFIELAILGGITLFVALPWQIYAQSLFPSEYLWEQHFNKLHFIEGLEGHGQPWWYFINRIRINVNELIYFILLWFAYYASQNGEFRKNLFLLIYIAIPFLVFSIAKTKMQGYLLFTFPAYFIVTGLFVERLLFVKREKFPKLIINKISVFVVVVIFFLAVRYGLERVKPFNTNQKERLAKKELLNANFPSKSVLFNIPCPIELMFYTNCIAYPFIPDDKLINELYSKNFNLFIVDDDNLPSEVNENGRITKIKMYETLRICQ